MDWANERYVRVYVRDTGDWLMWPWQTRALLVFIFRKLDRSGVLKLGKGRLRALAAIVGMPEGEVATALEPLLEDGCVQMGEDELVVPNFMEAQETPQSDKLRKQASRERTRDEAIASVGHTVSRAVTPSHTASRLVTPCLAVPSQTEPCSADLDADTAAPDWEEPESGVHQSAPPIAMPGGDPEIRAIADAIEGEKRLHAIHFDAYGIAETGMPVTLRKSLAAYLEAVHDAAGETLPGEVAQLTASRVRRFLKAAKEPRGEKPVQGESKGGAAYQDFKFDAGELGPARARKRATAQDLPPPPPGTPRDFSAIVKGLGTGPGRNDPELTQAEKDAKRLADKRAVLAMDEGTEPDEGRKASGT